MNLNPQIFSEVVERIRHETKWSWNELSRHLTPMGFVHAKYART
jgi:hypothetical protein